MTETKIKKNVEVKVKFLETSFKDLSAIVKNSVQALEGSTETKLNTLKDENMYEHDQRDKNIIKSLNDLERRTMEFAQKQIDKSIASSGLISPRQFSEGSPINELETVTEI